MLYRDTTSGKRNSVSARRHVIKVKSQENDYVDSIGKNKFLLPQNEYDLDTMSPTH